jgi:cytochrome P450
MPSLIPFVDLLAARTFAEGHPADVYRWLRDHDPVHWHDEPDGSGFWAITRYQDVRDVGRDPSTYSSEPTIMIDDPPAGDEATSMLGDHKMMLMSDPPYHTRLRRIISRDFTPRSTREMLDRLQGLAREVVDAVIERGSCDLVTDLAGEMPSYVIADLMGLPLEDGRKLYHLTETLHSAADTVSEEDRRAALGQMFGYALEVYGAKQEHPVDDLSSEIIKAKVDGHQLDQLDFALFFTLLVDAGGDTTRNLVAGGMHQLFEHPEQMDLLRSDLDRYLPNAIEEMLRHVSPVIYMRRTVTRDHTLAGVDIAAGDKVVMYYGAANRDPAVFTDGDRFDITRANASDHIAFGGGGPHFCLGANLARLEIEALLLEMLTRLHDLRPAGPNAWQASNFISGPKSMPVSFAPVAR